MGTRFMPSLGANIVGMLYGKENDFLPRSDLSCVRAWGKMYQIIAARTRVANALYPISMSMGALPSQREGVSKANYDTRSYVQYDWGLVTDAGKLLYKKTEYRNIIIRV
ncbi:uncharacterized protein Bfra_002176 [Botrytis fragariae]|uniref:Uncharacterized protein n=1 Tax=Botrytis fragariae TaxID=1964551 RepID=A0A8H6B1W6_9HELO|nr:uncharacterized protein Bfra_002176 [Botrytis fragariae]KAF5877806.1 hypothetical protein Bfra_002176 [Botrytis fragariae]